MQCTPQHVIASYQTNAPVDVVKLADSLGIKVWQMRLPEGVSGKIFLDPLNGGPSGYSIGVNGEDPFTRKRFTVAHEIAHYVLHRDHIGSGLTENAMYRSKLGTREEVQANKLAADILMPYPLIQKLAKEGVNSIESMAARLQVSVAAMKIRLGVPIY
jgi:hypothetical protein